MKTKKLAPLGILIISMLAGCASSSITTNTKNIVQSSLSTEKALTLYAWGENEVTYSNGFATTTARVFNYFGADLEVSFTSDENEPHSDFPYIFVTVKNIGSQPITIDEKSFTIIQDFSKDTSAMVQPSIRDLANYFEILADKKNRLEGAYAAFIVGATAAATATSRTTSNTTVSGNYQGNNFSAVGTTNSSTTDYGATAQVAANSIENARRRSAANESQAKSAAASLRKIAFKRNTLRPNEVAKGALFFGVKDQAHTRYKISLLGAPETSVSVTLGNY